MSTVLPISIVVAPSFTMVALRGRNLLICTRDKRMLLFITKQTGEMVVT